MFDAYRRAMLSLLLMVLTVGASLAVLSSSSAQLRPVATAGTAAIDQSDAEFVDPATGDTIPDGTTVALTRVDMEVWTDPYADINVTNKEESHAGTADASGYWYLSDVNLTEGLNAVKVTLTNDTNVSWSMFKVIVRDTLCLLVVNDIDSPVAKTAIDIRGLTEPGATVTVGSSLATVGEDGTWTFHVTLSEGSNLLNIVATDSVGNVKTISTTVVRDMTPPVVLIDSPADDTVVNVTMVTVAGRCEVGATVWVNGVLAVSDGTTWTALVPLKAGANTITVTAKDSLGNQAVAQTRTVTYAPPPSASQDDLDELSDKIDDVDSFTSILLYLMIILFVISIIAVSGVWVSLNRRVAARGKSRSHEPPATEEVETQSDVEREFEQLEKEIGKEER